MVSAHRVQFLANPGEYFTAVRKVYAVPWSRIAQDIRVSTRTITSWRRQETTMPVEIAKRWERELGVILPSHKIINLDEKRRKAGSLGGRARQERHGNLGTPEGRSRGGFRSWHTHKKNPSSPFIARGILHPKRSTRLAELVGAILGDGSLTEYQLILYSNFISDRAYSDFLSDLIAELFGITPSMTHDPSQGVTRVICSSKNVVNYLQSIGLGLGNKTKRQASVPSWILRNRSYSNACMRGLIDTDGCVYLDRHHINERDYASLCIAFTNASKPLLDFVFGTWESLGLHPTRHGRNIRLRRRKEVLRYTKIVGFSNPKHMLKTQV